MRTELGRSVGATKSTQLVWLNQFTGSQPLIKGVNLFYFKKFFFLMQAEEKFRGFLFDADWSSILILHRAHLVVIFI